jgi:predicted transcriptional regulator of viral defense system
MKHDEFLRKHPVFTHNDLAEHMQSVGHVGGRAQESLLAYYSKLRRVARVRRGLYAVIPRGVDPDHYQVDPFLIAAKSAPDSVLSHHTALEFHGKAYSVSMRLTYLAARPHPPLMFRGYLFQGSKFPDVLYHANKANAEVLTEEHAGLEIRVTSLERTLVDVLDRPELSGSWEEIWRSLELVEFFDLDRVVEYAVLTRNATTIAKVGFFLEQHRDLLWVEDRHVDALLELRPRQPHYLERLKRKDGRLVSKWNLVVPSQVLERTWEEVL